MPSDPPGTRGDREEHDLGKFALPHKLRLFVPGPQSERKAAFQNDAPFRLTRRSHAGFEPSTLAPPFRARAGTSLTPQPPPL